MFVTVRPGNHTAFPHLLSRRGTGNQRSESVWKRGSKGKKELSSSGSHRTYWENINPSFSSNVEGTRLQIKAIRLSRHLRATLGRKCSCFCFSLKPKGSRPHYFREVSPGHPEAVARDAGGREDQRTHPVPRRCPRASVGAARGPSPAWAGDPLRVGLAGRGPRQPIRFLLRSPPIRACDQVQGAGHFMLFPWRFLNPRTGSGTPRSPGQHLLLFRNEPALGGPRAFPWPRPFFPGPPSPSE